MLDGVTPAYISYAPDLAIPGATDAIRAFVERAVERGVRRLVLLSGRGVEEAQRCALIIQRPDIEWTVVRASWFCQNFSEGAFFDIVLAGEIPLPTWEVAEPFVDADDIAGCRRRRADRRRPRGPGIRTHLAPTSHVHRSGGRDRPGQRTHDPICPDTARGVRGWGANTQSIQGVSPRFTIAEPGFEEDGDLTEVRAIDISTGREAWRYSQRAPNAGSTLATGGNVVFFGDLNRRFRAFDAETGQVLWGMILGSQITGCPVTYAVGGRQYLSVPVGGASVFQLTNYAAELEAPAGSNMRVTFTLPESVSLFPPDSP